MKERGILFSGEMVRAILDGRKTMMRRPIKDQPEPFIKRVYMDKDGAFFASAKEKGTHGHDYLMRECPYGQPGDLLWVHETFYVEPEKYIQASAISGYGGTFSEEVFYRADDANLPGALWRPSIHMPRWASRILLEIISVRVERIRYISLGDVFKEGKMLSTDKENPDDFQVSWNATYPGSWDRNDWVWVIEFKRIKP